jgi:hypothetical protein
MSRRGKPPQGKKLIFRPWITHPKTGDKIYPKKGKFFPIWVDNVDPNTV